MKNILFISHSGKAGGAEQVLSYTINNTFNDHLKYRLFVIYPKFQGKKFMQLIHGRNVVSKSIFYRANSKNVLKSLFCNLINIPALIYLVGYCVVKRIDLIYVNSSVNFIGVILSVLAGKKVIWHIHEQSNQNVSVIPKYMRRIYKKLFNSKKIFPVFVSERNKVGWEKELSMKLRVNKVIYPPIRKSIVRPSLRVSNELCFGYLGAFVKEKNIVFLMNCFKQVITNCSSSSVKLKLVLGGSGILFDEIMMKCEELEILNQVEVIGFNDDVSFFFSKIDVLVQPSFNESWGLVALEALSYKKTLLLTKESGLVEILDDGIDCIIIDPLSKSDLIEKMTYLIENRLIQIQLSKNGYRKFEAQNFNENYNNEIKSLFDEIE